MPRVNALAAALGPVQFQRLRLTLRPRGAMELPPQQGSSIRGALAASLKRLVCMHRELDSCKECEDLHRCCYPYLFETQPPPGAIGVRGFEQFPRPYVISYPAPDETPSPSRTREIGLTLVGQAIPFFPFLALALRDLESRGIGRGRGQFDLAEVIAIGVDGARTLVYDGSQSMLMNGAAPITGAKISTIAETKLSETKLSATKLAETKLSATESSGANRLDIRFLSPTALQHNGRTAARPEFHILVRNLLRRVSMLAMGHCAHRMEIDFAGWIAQSQQVAIEEFRSRPAEWERYSNRQRRRVPMQGFVGEAIYRGDIEPFLPLILLGSCLHVGDNCTYGMGRYIVRRTSPGASNDAPWQPTGWAFAEEQ